MTVKILSESQKRYIVYFYSNRHRTSEELADDFRVSKRTIQRVLTEHGVSRRRRSPQPKQQVLAFNPGPTAFVEEATTTITQPIPELTWFERSLALFKRHVNRLLKRTHEQQPH